MTARNTQSQLARLRVAIAAKSIAADWSQAPGHRFVRMDDVDAEIDKLIAEPEGEREELPELQPGGLEIVGLPAGTIRHEVTDRGVLRLVFTPAEEPAPSEAKPFTSAAEVTREGVEKLANRTVSTFGGRDLLAQDWLRLDDENKALRRATAPAAAERPMGTCESCQKQFSHDDLVTGEDCDLCRPCLAQLVQEQRYDVGKTIGPAPAADAEFEAALDDEFECAIGELESAARAYQVAPLSRCREAATLAQRQNALRALHARRIAEAEARVPAPQGHSAGLLEAAEEIATVVVQRVAELPDRDSPKGWPEAMLVTGEELHAIVVAIAAERARRQS